MTTFAFKDARNDSRRRHPDGGKRRKPSPQPGLFGIRSWKKSRLVLACVFGAVSVFPLLYMVSLSFQPTSDIQTSNPVLVPTHPTFLNYVQAWSENSFGHYFLNSLVVALGTVVITVIVSSLAAFAFARYRFPFKEIIFYVFLAALAVPSVELIIPQYLLVLKLHLTDSLLGLVLIYASENLPFSIFLLRGFFEAVPKDLEESFRLDGAGSIRVLTRLIAPLSAPALAVVAMFTFNFAWEEFVVALTLINSPSHRTLPIGLNFFIGEHTTQWGPLFAGSVIATIPSVIVYAISQRWFQRGVSLGGIR
ncbi:MAG TPA: carbohydrate ABC transporter permease [Acidimicrobiales bacterium]|nr:carbohydrate ABC transporter permease [Acidimicrobiales bacterium]